MDLLGSIVELFTKDYSITDHFEDFDLAQIKIQTYALALPELSILKSKTAILQNGDKLSIYISIGDNDVDAYSGIEDKYAQFAADTNIKLGLKEEGELIIISINISKQFDGCFISIYNIGGFTDYLSTLSIQQLLAIFSTYLISLDAVAFRCFELHNAYSTTSISFLPVENTEHLHLTNGRKERIATIYSSVQSSSSLRPSLLPEEFIFTSRLNVPPGILEIFDKCAFVLLLLALFDLTTIEDDGVSYKLNGYKTIEGKWTNSNTIDSFIEFKSIYDWVYTSGNLIDKLGLARNIISLHLDDVDKLTIKGNPYQSILSSYQVYQKQNIKQYIEIRNKISEQLVDFNKRATSIVDTFASGYQKSALTLVTFFSTLVAIKFLTATTLSLTFSLNAFVISCVFLTVSFIYLLILRYETTEQKIRFERSYSNMKARYTDLLTVDDIKKILNNDEDHDCDKSFISDKLRWYTRIWATTLCLILAATFILFVSGAYEVVKNMVDVFIYGYIKSI